MRGYGSLPQRIAPTHKKSICNAVNVDPYFNPQTYCPTYGEPMRTFAYLLILVALAVSNPFSLLVSRLSLLHIELDLLTQAVALFEAAYRLLSI